MIKTVFLDLDGTLLPMDQDLFTKAYFKALTQHMAAYRNPDELIKAVWVGTEAMIRNDGKETNETVFWKTYTSIFGSDSRSDLELFTAFYEQHFDNLKSVCMPTPDAGRLISFLQKNRVTAVLASNPLFPMIAQEKRVRWAGLSPADFAFITSYESSTYCKPSPGYYEELLHRLRLNPAETLMVGNDAEEDIAAAETGMQVFLLTDNPVNRRGRDLSVFPNGSYPELFDFLENRFRS